MKFILIFLIIFSLYGCEDGVVLPEEEVNPELKIFEGNNDSLTILDENNYIVGKLSVLNDKDSLYINVNLEKAFLLESGVKISNNDSFSSFNISLNKKNNSIIKFNPNLFNDFAHKYSLPTDSIETNAEGFIFLSIDGTAKSFSDEIIIDLPPNVTMNYYGIEKPSDSSTFVIEVKKQNESTLFNGWCIGYNVEYGVGDYNAKVITSQNEFFSDSLKIKYPNIDQINWLINQSFIGKESLTNKIFSLRDIQIAIWYLLNQFQDNDWEKEKKENANWASEDNVKEILNLANSNGKNFLPTFGDNIAVILVPDNMYQEVLIEVPLERYLNDEIVKFHIDSTFKTDENMNYFMYQLKK